MSTNNPTFRYPFVLAGVSQEVRQAHVFAYNGILDLQRAIQSLKTQISSLTASSSSSSSSGGSSSTTAGVTSFNSETGAVSYFPNLGTIDDQTGQTAYNLPPSDNGVFVIFNDAAAVAVSLDPGITTPFFCFIMNWGAGTVTLTPTTPSKINYYGNIGATSMPILTGTWAMVEYDGKNFNAATIQVPVTFNAITHEWLRSYNATTGLFTASQPDFSDLSGQINPATQIPASGVTAASYKATNLTVNAEGLITAAADGILSGVSGALGGGALTAGQTITIAVTVTGAASGMVATCSPETYPGDGFVWDAYISAANTVTVRLTAVIAGTPTSSIYDVRVTK